MNKFNFSFKRIIQGQLFTWLAIGSLYLFYLVGGGDLLRHIANGLYAVPSAFIEWLTSGFNSAAWSVTFNERYFTHASTPTFEGIYLAWLEFILIAAPLLMLVSSIINPVYWMKLRSRATEVINHDAQHIQVINEVLSSVCKRLSISVPPLNLTKNEKASLVGVGTPDNNALFISAGMVRGLETLIKNDLPKAKEVLNAILLIQMVKLKSGYTDKVFLMRNAQIAITTIAAVVAVVVMLKIILRSKDGLRRIDKRIGMVWAVSILVISIAMLLSMVMNWVIDWILLSNLHKGLSEADQAVLVEARLFDYQDPKGVPFEFKGLPLNQYYKPYR